MKQEDRNVVKAPASSADDVEHQEVQQKLHASIKKRKRKKIIKDYNTEQQKN